MKLIMVIMIFLVLAFVSSSESPTKTTLSSQSQSSPSPIFSETYVDQAFAEWMLVHEKNYSSTQEFTKRRQLFKKELEYIEEFNKGNHGYIVGLNEFSDLDGDEFFVSCELEDDPPVEPVSFNITSIDQLPVSIDWRDHGAVTSVRKQSIGAKLCGSCWAFAATSVIESAWKLTNYDLYQLSPQQLVDCDTGSRGCNGGKASSAFVYVAGGGIAKEVQYPYKAMQQPCHDKGIETTVKISGYRVIASNDIQLMNGLTSQPVAVSIRIDDAFKSYRGGIFRGPCGDRPHAVTLIGYGQTDSGELYWIIKNSWGEKWGEKGYGRMLRASGDSKGICGILRFPIIPITDDF